jgi:hypothetical protein
MGILVGKDWKGFLDLSLLGNSQRDCSLVPCNAQVPTDEQGSAAEARPALSAYVSIRQLRSRAPLQKHVPLCQHTSAYVSCGAGLRCRSTSRSLQKHVPLCRGESVKDMFASVVLAARELRACLYVIFQSLKHRGTESRRKIFIRLL